MRQVVEIHGLRADPCHSILTQDPPRESRGHSPPHIESSQVASPRRDAAQHVGNWETKTFNYDRGARLLADVMDIEKASVLDCFVEAGSKLQRTQVVPETGDAIKNNPRIPPTRYHGRY